MDNNGVLGNLMNNTYGQDLIRNIIGTMYTPEQISAFKPADMADVSKRVGDFMSDPKWTRNNPMQMQQGQGQQVAYDNAYAATGQGQTLAQMIPNQPDYADATTRAYNDYWGSRSTPSTPSAPSAPSAPKARPKDAVTGGVIRQGKMTPTTYESYR